MSDFAGFLDFVVSDFQDRMAELAEIHRKKVEDFAYTDNPFAIIMETAW